MALHVDFEFLSALVTLVWFLGFIGLWLWAWSGRRQRDYAAAARMPLDASADNCTAQPDGSS